MLRTTLQKLGLSEKEIALYLIVLQHQRISVADAAKISRINRTTVYAVAKELLKKGIIQEEIGVRTMLIARPPESLEVLLEYEQQELNRKTHLLKTAITELQPFAHSMRHEVPRLAFVDADQLEKHLYQESERWSQSIMEHGGSWYGFQDHSFIERYNEWIDWYWQQPFTKNLQVRLFSNDSVIEKEMQKKKLDRRLLKWWQGKQITSTMWIAGEYLIMIATKQNPHYLFEIHDALLAENMRTIFEELWKTK